MRENGHIIFTITILVLVLSGWTHSVIAQEISEEQASRETGISELRLVEPAFGINIGFVENHATPGGGKYVCGGMTEEGATSAAKVASNALSKLPASSRARIKLKYLILCSRVLVSERAVGGFPIPPLKLLMIDARGNNEHIVLHELYHLVEFQFNTINDAEWNRRFGDTGYANSYLGLMPNSRMASGQDGFLNNYSRTFPHEERAELFAYLVLNPRGVANQIRKSDDDIIEQKIKFMIEKSHRLLGLDIKLPRR